MLEMGPFGSYWAFRTKLYGTLNRGAGRKPDTRMPGAGFVDGNRYTPKGHIIDTKGHKFSSVGLHGMGKLEEDPKEGFFRFVIVHAAGDIEFRYDYLHGDYTPVTAKEAAERDRFIIEEEWASLAGLRK